MFLPPLVAPPITAEEEKVQKDIRKLRFADEAVNDKGPFGQAPPPLDEDLLKARCVSWQAGRIWSCVDSFWPRPSHGAKRVSRPIFAKRGNGP